MPPPGLKPHLVNLKTAAVVFGFLAPLSAGIVRAADLHPIIEIETGYFFGGSENGKWIKADQTAKSTGKKTTYQVYGLTKQAGEITAGKPKSVDEPCPDTLMVSLSSKPKDGVIGLAATWNALPRKPVIADATQSVYVEAVRDFLKTRAVPEPKVQITQILRVDLDGDGEEEVLISATNYFNDDKSTIHPPRRSQRRLFEVRSLEVIPLSSCDGWSTGMFKHNSWPEKSTRKQTSPSRRMCTTSLQYLI